MEEISHETPVRPRKPRGAASATRPHRSSRRSAVVDSALPDADPLSSAPPLDLRRHMIAEAAYFRAERRGFCGGDSERLDDWLQAEMEIGRLLATECETEVVGQGVV